MKIDRRIGWRFWGWWRCVFDGAAKVSLGYPGPVFIAGRYRVILDREELRAIGAAQSGKREGEG